MSEGPVQHRFTGQPVCPHCGYIMQDAWELDFGGMEGETTVNCGSCDEEYEVSRFVDVHYSTEKKTP